MHSKVVIIGSGPAGYTAAIYAARANLNPVMIMGDMVGGQLLYTHKIENFPGVMNISGCELIDIFQKQIEELNVSTIFENVISVNFKQKPFLLNLSNGQNITADSVIIACGAKAKWLGVEGEEKFKGHGISVCATCDGFFYKNAYVAVVGGGNTALYESLFLSSIAQKILIINKNESFSGEAALIQKVLNNSKIEVINETEILKFDGDENLTCIEVKNTRTQEIQNLMVDGVFIAIGQTPQADLFKTQIDLDSAGYIQTNEKKETSIAGVFAAGDIQESYFRQAIVACSSGAIAAMSAERYLLEIKKA